MPYPVGMSAPSATQRHHPVYPVRVELVPDSPVAGLDVLWSATVPTPGGVLVPVLDVPCRVRMIDATGEVCE